MTRFAAVFAPFVLRSASISQVFFTFRLAESVNSATMTLLCFLIIGNDIISEKEKREP